MKNKYCLFFLCLLINTQTIAEEKTKGRWYTESLVDKGYIIFRNNCARCHGQKAQGFHPNWKKPLPDGSYPPPPLNGNGHAWHHPIKTLVRSISNGGKPLGGTMPAFKDKLSKIQQVSTIAYFQSFWNEKIYNAWLQRGGIKK